MLTSVSVVECQSTVTTTTTTPPLVKMVEIEGKGRALVASKSLHGGEIVLRDSPILIYSALPLKQSSSNESNYCSHCFRKLYVPTSTLVVSCSSCFHALFCSSNCRMLALSSSHTPWVCQALTYLRGSPTLPVLDHERQVQARFLIAAYNLAVVSPSSFRILLSLQGGGSDADSAADLFLHSLISSLSWPPSQSVVEFSAQLTAALLAKDKLNAFGLMEPVSPDGDGERSVRAYGIYPNASFFNHDCLPNACRFDYVDDAPEQNTDIIIRMIHDIPEGREICLSYFPVNEKYSNRQKRLMGGYGFSCECDRCKVEVNWSDNEEEEQLQDPDQDQDQDQDVMDEDNDEHMEAVSSEDESASAFETDNSFPHAYFFLRYMCNRDSCGGTLAPLPPSDGSSSNVMECNVCGSLKNDDEFIDGDTREDRTSMDD